MEWFKVWVTLRDDPKVLGLSDRAFRDHVIAMCWTAHHEKDGVVHASIVSNQRIVDELLRAGLWDRDADGTLRIHNWLGRQRSAEEVDAARSAARNAARIRWGRESHSDAHSGTDAPSNAEEEVEVEGEVEPRSTPSRSSRSAEAELLVGFDEFYAAYPRKRAPGDARKAWLQMRRAGVAADQMIAAAGTYAADPHLPVDKTKIPYPATWLRSERFRDDPLEAPGHELPPRRRRDRAAEIVGDALREGGESPNGRDPGASVRGAPAGVLPGD